MLDLHLIEKAHRAIKPVISRTPLVQSTSLSEKYGCNLYLKREDLQTVRSYKIRGAYFKMVSLSESEKSRGIVCASAGNHAQGVAFACKALQIRGKIFMPHTTPKQKVTQVKMFGKEWIEVILGGDTFDVAYSSAMEACEKHGQVFIHPFDDKLVMAGQGTTGIEILEDLPAKPDLVIIPVGGGGLAAGLGSYLKQKLPEVELIGVEPEGAPAMFRSLLAGKVVKLDTFDRFVDGAAVQKPGELTFAICQEVLKNVVLVPEGKVCTTILQLYNLEAMVVEPAGALSIAALDFLGESIKGKTVVCLVSGGNNDITRTEEIRERSLQYEGLKHYFIIRFPQRAGALREFLVNVLGPDDDITRFEYTKKNNRENGPALVGIELKQKEDFNGLLERMALYQINYQELRELPDLFQLLV
jgi:threonine dehydratase